MKRALAVILPVVAVACSNAPSGSTANPSAPVASADQPQPTQQHPAPRLDDGKRIYTTFCASCHGTAGKGDGPAAKGLTPAPADLTRRGPPQARKPRWATVLEGSPGTAMVAFGKILNEKQLGELHRYLGTLRHGSQPAGGHHGPRHARGHGHGHGHNSGPGGGGGGHCE